MAEDSKAVIGDANDTAFWQCQVVELKRLLESAGDDPILAPQLSERLMYAKRICDESILKNSKSLSEYIRNNPPKGFKPIPHRSDIGNFIEWFWKDEDHYAEPVYHNGKWMGTVYRSFKTKEVIGVQIHLESVSEGNS